MQVENYSTRNFATLEPSRLQLPFAGDSIQDSYTDPSSYLYGTGQVSDPLHHNNILQSPVFLVNSRHSLICATLD